MPLQSIDPKREFTSDGVVVVIHAIDLEGPADRCIIGRAKNAKFDDPDIKYDLSGQAWRHPHAWNLDQRVPEVEAFINAVKEARRQASLSAK